MRKLCAIACLAVLGLCAPNASAQGVDRCAADAEWEVTFVFQGDFYADVTVDETTATGTGCDGLLPAGTKRYDLDGVVLFGLPFEAFTVTATSRTDDERGSVTVARESLHAVLGSASAGTTAVHSGTTTCGTTCWETRGTWTGAAP